MYVEMYQMIQIYEKVRADQPPHFILSCSLHNKPTDTLLLLQKQAQKNGAVGLR